MLVVMSWNVAGLSTTVHRIHEAYKNEVEGGQDAFGYFLRRHQVDILCLQEHKIPSSQLSNRSEPFRCASVEGYESFWSKTTRAGMNGVVTYARKGLTRSATATPLGSPDLDDQGRCIQTDHGHFVLFNVYAPCNGGHSVRMKMKFLHALRRAMRACGKPVVLVGDLNITHRGIDKYWKDRSILVDDIIAKQDNEPWKQDVVKAWPTILQTLKTMEVIEAETTNTLTGTKFQKYRLVCTLPDKRRIFLGKHESKPEYCEWQYNFNETWYTCPETGMEKLSCRANIVSLGTLTELLAKVCGIVWDEATQRHIANSIDGVCNDNPPRMWLNDLIEKDEMVDVFRHFYPDAQGRFTCWNQFTNRRYENEGARIDYILVDKSLLSRVERGDSALHTPDPNLDFRSEEAALCAATANGAYRPVSFEGEGIASVSRAILDTQFKSPHTGMIYTPPSFSDHIGISMILTGMGTQEESILLVTESNNNDTITKDTKRTQPHKMQRSIASFLTAKRPASTMGVIPVKRLKGRTTNDTNNNYKTKPKTILHHFGVRDG
jgi:exodeoxyribonuclease III